MELRARVARIRQETPTVKSFLLDVPEVFTFLAGQWIDLYIERPGQEPLVGGYTPTQSGSFELAIKRSDSSRAAAYLHEHARVGESYWIAGPSGDFYFRQGMAGALLLVAGGIGVNPPMSIVRYIDAATLQVPTTLVCSARSPSELLFAEELRAIAARNPLLRCLFTVTRPGGEPWQGRVGRVDRELLREALPTGEPLCYLCGPPGMPTSMAGALSSVGVPPGRIRFEEW